MLRRTLTAAGGRLLPRPHGGGGVEFARALSLPAAAPRRDEEGKRSEYAADSAVHKRLLATRHAVWGHSPVRRAPVVSRRTFTMLTHTPAPRPSGRLRPSA